VIRGAQLEPLFPFGYGLSYMGFEFTHVQISGHIKRGQTVEAASFVVKNIGQCSGASVPQPYLVSAAGKPIPEVGLLHRITRVVPNSIQGAKTVIADHGANLAPSYLIECRHQARARAVTSAENLTIVISPPSSYAPADSTLQRTGPMRTAGFTPDRRLPSHSAKLLIVANARR
jgi:hypothetical protein